MAQPKLTAILRGTACRALGIATILALPATALTQSMPMDPAGQTPAMAPSNTSLADQVSELQGKVAQLEMQMHHKPGAGGEAAGMRPGAGGAMPGMSDGKMPGGMKAMGEMPGTGSGGAMPTGGSTGGNSMGGMGGGGMGKMDMDAKKEMGTMGGGGMPGTTAPGMKGAGGGMDMDKMDMGGMMGMGAMGSSAAGAMPRSVLPGFPGASHLYHIGATGFFLDHPQHITLTMEQQAGLNKSKEQALLAKSTADRAVEQADQELWTLTAADQPDGAKIEAKISEVEKLRGDERLSFIRAVGEASKILTDEQRKILTGFAPPTPLMSAPAGAAPAMAAPMGDM